MKAPDSNRKVYPCHVCKIPVPKYCGIPLWDSHRGWILVCRNATCVSAEGLGDEPGILTADGCVYLGRSMLANLDAWGLARAMPGARWDPRDRCWYVSTEIRDRDRVCELASRLGCEISRHLIYTEPEHVKAAMQRAKNAGLYPYQVAGVRWLALRDRALLADDMGLGKTVQVLMSLSGGSRTLIVTPKSVASVWALEAAKWRPDLWIEVVEDKPRWPEKWIPDPGQIVVATYERIPDRPARYDMGPGLTIVLDEAQAVKNPETNRSQRVRAIASKCQKRILLTGTPLPNKPPDLYGVLSSCGLEKETFGSWNRFCWFFRGRKVEMPMGGKKGSKRKVKVWVFGNPRKEVPEILRRVMLRRLKQDVLDQLPDKVRQSIPVTVSDRRIALRLQELQEIWQSRYEKAGGDLSELLSLFSGIRKDLAEMLIPVSTDIADRYQAAKRPLIVFSAHRAPLSVLGSRPNWASITGQTSAKRRAEHVEAFQTGKLEGLALQILAGGTGITLTHGSDVLFVDLAWNPDQNDQAEDRVCRIGQKADSIRIMDLVPDHPMTWVVHNKLRTKKKLINRAVEKEMEI